MKTIILIIGISLCLFNVTCYGQSIYGNVNSSYSARNLDYANVNIYKNGKLVANVLTDKNGDFNVKLDTGEYKCEIVYAGYKKIVKDVKVTKDEKADFKMNEDEKAKYSAAKIEEYKVMTDKLAFKPAKAGIETSNMWGESKKGCTGEHGKLTAGEINDFSKWDLWGDLAKGELKSMQTFWQFAPTERYTLQLIDQIGLPLANAKVELLNGDKVIFTSRSDNTGKAELWRSLKPDSLPKIFKASIRINYKGETQTMNDVKNFDKCINTFVFETKCEQSQNVDIAIVVDATGSMQDEIDYLKSDLNDVVFKSKEISKTLNLRFANIFYRDHGDAYITQTQDFTNVLSESIAFTSDHNAGGGGDEEESVEIALDSAINKLSWNPDTRTKILFLVLDASPHNTYEIQDKIQKLCNQASEKGIRIVPVTGSGTNKNAEYFMRCLALATNGTYTFLTDHSAIGGTHLKPSTDSYQVEVLNDLLVRIIKSYSYMPDCQQYVTDLGVNLPDSQVVIYNPIDTTKTVTTLSHPEDSIDIQWKFYPNPTNGLVNIESNKEIAELYISDLSGKALQVIRNISPGNVVTVDLSQYSTGIYLIRYPVGKQWVSGKISLMKS